MTDIPRRGGARTAKLATLPLGYAGRTAAGWGKRLTGQSSAQVSAEMNRKTAEQLFAVLGELKGGAMKFGQALSVFEAAVPEEMAEPYREALTKLQSAAPPMSASTVHRVLAEQLGSGWRTRFTSFDDVPAAAASIGQVHRAVWSDGRDVAVKVQYPGADEALRSDLRQLQRLSRVISAMMPGLDAKALVQELRDRMVEELDYRGEADNQRAFAAEFADDPDFIVPAVIASAPKVVVSEWVEGTPLARVIADGTQEERNHAGMLLTLFHYSSPARVGLLHSDPHPGNYMVAEDGRLIVIDFGAVAHLPDGLPSQLGTMVRLALADERDELMTMMRAEQFLRRDVDVDPQAVMDYLEPFVATMRTEVFHFTRAWMQQQAARVGDPNSEDFQLGLALNLPPQYLLIQRVTMGSVGILCQLSAEGPFGAIMRTWAPGVVES